MPYALDAHDGNVLDAIIELERSGKAHTTSELCQPQYAGAGAVGAGLARDGRAQEACRRRRDVRVWEGVKNVFRKSIDWQAYRAE